MLLWIAAGLSEEVNPMGMTSELGWNHKHDVQEKGERPSKGKVDELGIEAVASF